jgi:hypothetical protein
MNLFAPDDIDELRLLSLNEKRLGHECPNYGAFCAECFAERARGLL